MLCFLTKRFKDCDISWSFLAFEKIVSLINNAKEKYDIFLKKIIKKYKVYKKRVDIYNTISKIC